MHKYTANFWPIIAMDKKLDIKWYRSIDSTNLQAHREIADAAEGCVWVADYQTAGRGQRGNSWESGAGENLLFTVLLRPDFLHVAKQFAISQITALAIVKWLETKGLSPKIKWPNDIYVGDKKICGILIEHAVAGVNLSASILGIGININQTRFCSDAPNPISLLLALQGKSSPADSCEECQGSSSELQPLNRQDELAQVLSHLMELYDSLYSCSENCCSENHSHENQSNSEGGTRLLNASALEQINNEYHSYLYRKGEWHKFLEVNGQDKKEIEGKILGVNEFGCLLLECPDRSVSDYSFQQIRYIL